jgi:3-oxoacyl-[acyl-carrier protein] reductase
MSEGNGAQELAGTAAVVTGSNRNIGRGIALALADAGAAVVINAHLSRDLAEGVANEITDGGGRAFVHMADVTDEAQVAGLIQAAVDEFGGLDILVNNVAARKQTLMADTSYEDWREVMVSVLDSTFLCTRAAIPHLIASGRGSIVNLGGVSGFAGVPLRSHVATAKAGISGMTGSLAVELAPHNITVNCISPGHIDTSHDGGLPKHFQDKTAPLGRAGTVEEIAATARFLCGPGGRYITGETIHVNGGWHINIA